MKYVLSFIVDIFKGMVIGVANIIPGVSGGTMAVAMGVYDKIVKILGNLFTSIFKDFKNTMLFCIPIGIGAVGGILVFSRIIEHALEKYNMQTISLFIGLIIGTIPLIFSNANKNGFKKTYLIPAIITFLGMASLFFISSSTDLVFGSDFISYMVLLGLGIVAAATMIIPGISGSFVLMLLGAYAPILRLVNTMNWIPLIPFAIGVVLGIISCSKLVDELLKHAYGYTYYTIIGFILGSLVLIFKELQFVQTAILPSIGLLVVGGVFSYFFGKATKNM